MSEQTPPEVALAAQAALDDGRAADAVTAYRRLVRAAPDEVVWRLRLGDALAAAGDDVAALEVREGVALAALETGEPLAGLVAALAIGLDDLTGWFADYLAGSEKLGKARTLPPLPPLPPGAVPADEPGAPLPAFGRPQQGPPPPLPLLSSLDAAAFAAVVPALSRRALRAGEALLAEGDAADALYLVAGGQLEAVKAEADRDVVVGRAGPGAILGEMALVLDRPRTATVRAATDAELVRVELAALRGVAEANAAVREALEAFTRQRLTAIVLGTSPLFRDLDLGVRAALLTRFSTRSVPAGEILIAEGDPGAALWLVVDGAVDVQKADEDGAPARVARLGAGEVFGEIALITGAPASASVLTAEPSTLLSLAREHVAQVWGRHPELRERLEKLGADRISDNRFIFDDDDFFEIAD